MFGISRPRKQRLIKGIHDIQELLHRSRYTTEAMPPKPMGEYLHDRIRIAGRDLRVVVTHHAKHLTFLNAYRLNGRFNVENMQQWNYSKQFASYTYSGDGDVAVLKHNMLSSYGVPEETFMHFLETWRDLASAFQKHCGISESDRI
jgi:hypothetical protein